MTRMIALATCALLGFAPAIRAQVFVPAPGGISFQYASGKLKVSGSYAPGLVIPVGPGGVVLGPPGYLVSPYGAVERRVIVQKVGPPPMPRVVLPPEPDVSGIDLDLESPDKLYPPGTAPARKPVVKPVEPKVEQPKKPPEELLKPPETVKPEAPAPPMKPPPEDLLTPRAVPADESRRLVDLGLLTGRIVRVVAETVLDIDKNICQRFAVAAHHVRLLRLRSLGFTQTDRIGVHLDRLVLRNRAVDRHRSLQLSCCRRVYLLSASAGCACRFRRAGRRLFASAPARDDADDGTGEQ